MKVSVKKLKNAKVVESTLCQVLDLLTGARIESLNAEKRKAVKNLRLILRNKNVVGVGVSEKTRKGKPIGKLALAFYVKKKIPLQQLNASIAVPSSVPEALANDKLLLTDVVVLGEIRPEAKVSRDKISPGYSIGHVGESAGTLGAFVTRGGGVLLLSNSHVLARSGRAKKNDKIVYPGLEDGGKPPTDVIAKLVEFRKFQKGKAFTNRVDCAIAEPLIQVKAKLRPQIDTIGLPRGTTTAKRGMKIIKVGRTTGKTSGTVKDVHFRFVLNYDGVGEVGFVDQVLCSRYSQPGDSGALVLEAKTKRAIGLHFAGANGGSVFCPIDEVLKTMKVRLVTKP